MKWQPIETAPKDGTEIIAWGIRFGSWGYTEDRKCWTGVKWDRGNWERPGNWFETRATPQYSAGFKPTHWMPLPEPPK